MINYNNLKEAIQKNSAVDYSYSTKASAIVPISFTDRGGAKVFECIVGIGELRQAIDYIDDVMAGHCD